MDNDIKRKKRPPNKQSKVWQDIIVKKPTANKTDIPQKKTAKFKFSITSKLILPKFSKPQRIRRIPLSKKNVMIVLAVVSLALLSATYYFSQNHRIIINKDKGNMPYKTTKLETGTPSYSTITPNRQKTTWTKISPPGSDTSIYAYVDKIGDVSISVTEQPLPDEFKTDTAYKIEKLAKNYDANIKLTAENTVIYVGTSVRDSIQSVILTKGNLLIMIKSKNIVSNQDWVNYINSME